jgi:adsorption protein B
VKQRSRWVTGISLQTWERHGWNSNVEQAYWIWRDRKGLLGSPIGLAANLLTFYGALSLAASGAGSGFARAVTESWLGPLLAFNLIILLVNMSVRFACVADVYGVGFAVWTPLRSAFGNLLNSVATFRAICMYSRARLSGRPLVWVKTEHAYPSRAGLLPHKRPIGEILTGSGYLTPERLGTALMEKPRGVPLLQHLVGTGALSEEEAYEALSLQLGMALGEIDPAAVGRNVARSLPERVVRKWQVLPVKIEAGNLHVACPAVPSEEMQDALRQFTSLEIQVQLVTPANFRRLAEALL